MRRLIVFFLLIACTEHSVKQSIADGKNIDSSINVEPEYLSDPDNTLENKVQKIELEFIPWRCDCASWITPLDRKKFNYSELTEHSIFIEPADTTQIFPDSTFDFEQNNILVIGQYYVMKDYPKGTYGIPGRLKKAKVFRYLKLEIIPKKNTNY